MAIQEATTAQVVRLLQSKEPAALILRRTCALLAARTRDEKKSYRVDPERCLGDACGCERFCTRVWSCPGNVWDEATGKARIDEVVCSGCGVCATLCPRQAIVMVQ